MRLDHAYASRSISELYRWFAGEAEPTSPVWARLSRWIAETPALVDRLEGLVGRKRQPNLFLAAIRYLGGPTEPGDDFLAWVDTYWPGISELIETRSTQTNEPGRNAVIAPLLASLPQPVTLLEVGSSAGLGLIPDRFRYRYSGDVDLVTAAACATPDAPVLDCRVTGALPGDPGELVVAERLGLDLNPLRPADDEDIRWLRALVWPGEEARESRLVRALEVAARRPPRVLRGDLTAGLERLLGAVPAGTTPVLAHAATLAYLTRPEIEAFEERVRAAGVRWISFEGVAVLASVRHQLADLEAWRDRPHFVVALDGRPVARAGAHGGWVEWLE